MIARHRGHFVVVSSVVGYIPSADEFPHGSYEAAASLFDARAEPLLVGAIRDGLARVGF